MIIEHTTTSEYDLRGEMKRRGLSIRALAERANVHYTYISRLLKKQSHASEEVAKRIIDALESTDAP